MNIKIILSVVPAMLIFFSTEVLGMSNKCISDMLAGSYSDYPCSGGWGRCQDHCFAKGLFPKFNTCSFESKGTYFVYCGCCEPLEPSYVAFYAGQDKSQCDSKPTEGSVGAYSWFRDGCFSGIKKEAWCDAKNNNSDINKRIVRGERMVSYQTPASFENCKRFCKALGGEGRRNDGGYCYCAGLESRVCPASAQSSASQQTGVQQSASKAK